MTVAITDKGVDIETAMNHLAQMWGEAEGYAWLASCGRGEVVNGKRKMVNWQQKSFAWPEGRDDVREYIEAHAATRELFYCPFVHASAGSKRKGASVERRWVCVDQDRPMTNPDALAPTLIVESGTPDHSHLYYSVPEGVGADEYQPFAQGIGDALGCGNDKTTDEGFFRMPGTMNLKHDPPILCEVKDRPGVTYTQQSLSDAVNVRASAHSHDRVTGAQDRSQGLQFEDVPGMRTKGTIKGRLNRELERISEGNDKSAIIYAAVRECIKAGYSPGQVATIIRKHPAMDFAADRFDTDADLLRDVERIAGKVEESPQMDNDSSGLSLLNLDELLTRGIEPVEWLVPQIFQRGGLYQVVSYAGMGKSLLMLDISQRLARGIEALPGAVVPDGDSTPSKALTVLYIDGENTRRIILSRLHEMNVRGLNRLKYSSMPPLLALDTERGGAEFVAHVRRVQAEVVVIDTLSRFVEGDENDAATYTALFRYALAPLRADGVTIIRLDHTGKDQSKGARGSSAKNTDVDGSWVIRGEKNSPRFTLVCDKDRTGDLAPVVPLRRTQEPLRHVATMLGGDIPTPSEHDDEVADLVAAADDANAPWDLGRERLKAVMKNRGHTARNDVWAAVVKARKGRGPNA